MSKKHRLLAEVRRMDKLNLNLAHQTIESPGHTAFAFEDPQAARLIGQFLLMALRGYRRPVLIHNGRKPR